MDEALPRRFGKYTLVKKLAVGGMAELFLALHRGVGSFEKLVVVKRILPHLAADASFIEMLVAEARIAATLNHPNIVQMFDVGAVDGQYFVAMEHVHGEDLRTIVRALKGTKGTVEKRFPLSHALQIGVGVSAGLAYAHEKRGFAGEPLCIVHRDVSPQNVIVTFTGDVKLVDFGIAKAAFGLGAEETAGQLKGKVPYMSPEQCRGEDLDARSDVFSVGILLFELTTGKRLFRAPSEVMTLQRIVESEYPRPSAVLPDYPAALEAIVLRALEKDRAVRYQSARELQADLERFVREERMPASALGLQSFMESLFEERLAAQREALLAGRQLAEVIAAEDAARAPAHVAEGDLEETPSGTNRSTGPRTPVWKGGLRGREPAATRRTALAALVAVVVVAVGSGIFALTRTKGDDATRGVLTLETDPPGASVAVDGVPRPGRTPTSVRGLPVDEPLALRVSLDGYEVVRQEIELPGDRESPTLQIKLRSLAETLGSVTVTSAPTNAAIFLDGVDTHRRTPATLAGLAHSAPHVLVAKVDGYSPQEIRVTLARGETRAVSIALVRTPLAADETLVVLRTDPADTHVTVGNRVLPGGSPYEFRLKADKGVPVVVSRDGYATWRRFVWGHAREEVQLVATLERGSETTAAGTAPAAQGTLRVGAVGFFCTVSVDGASLGNTPVASHMLAAGRHRVGCTNSGLGFDQVQTVSVTPGQMTIVRFQR